MYARDTGSAGFSLPSGICRLKPALPGKLLMLTRSANAITFDNGGGCVEMRRMPDGRWAVATGISVIATGKTPWMPTTREFTATRDAAVALFLAALPDDPALRERLAGEIAYPPGPPP